MIKNESYSTLKGIAKRFNVAPITIFRWIHFHGLPAGKLPGGTWYITEALIDTWLLARNKVQIKEAQEKRERNRERKDEPDQDL